MGQLRHLAKFVVHRLDRGHSAAASACIVSAFGNPGAARLWKLLRTPVIGIGEVAILEPATGGRRFGIATTTPHLVGAIEASARSLGVGSNFTGVRANQDEAPAASATGCIELDVAEAVIIGGGPLSCWPAAPAIEATIVEPVPVTIRRLLKARSEPDRAAGDPAFDRA